MKKISLSIKRKVQKVNKDAEYTVEVEMGKSTVLEALQKIQEEHDSSLAFRYGCRYKNCGLCGIKINGHPRMACMTKVKDKMKLEPLDNIPVIQDLIVERSFITETIQNMNLIPDIDHSIPVNLTKEFHSVNKCTECQVCLSGSSLYSEENRDQSPGPLFFVKLAQLYYHPQVKVDYKKIAKSLGIEKYRESEAIPCPYGIPIKKLAIDPFLVETD
ncbi:2Fe-2S iron-sulfur cluster binding domain-containing protein [bacterium LRH843]|nr:2Fe-2S iron-sulfur cluster binding domain-containing protein [bacterium LRH843]